MSERQMTVSFVGLGYVGLCTAVAFANRGFDTLGVDVDLERLALVEVGRAPIHEPGLERLLKTAILSGRLRVSDEIADVAETDVIFLTVGTPSRLDGSIDTSHVERASREVGAALRSQHDDRLVVVKSTVIPGTTRSVVKPLLEESSGKRVGAELGLCTNPEFLKEGSAIEDTFHPDKLVIGSIETASASRLRRLYRAFYGDDVPPTIETTPETAEMIKYASNAFLATKVSYINTMANIAQQVPGVDVEQVAAAIGLDPRIGPLFLKGARVWRELFPERRPRVDCVQPRTRLRPEPPCGRGEGERTTGGQSGGVVGGARRVPGGQAGRHPRPRVQEGHG